jgi:hypothetical protein
VRANGYGVARDCVCAVPTTAAAYKTATGVER